MPFDGLTITALSYELNSHLVGSRIDKIHQPEKDELIINMRGYKTTNRLLISANARWARMHLTEEKKENPSQAPNFCMLLRKHLEGGKIKSIQQSGLERIVHIRIEALNEFREWKEKILVCEFMGKHSNIILLDPENNTIIDAIKKYGSDISSYREVLPGKEYIVPPPQDKLDIRTADFAAFVQKMWDQEEDTSIYRALFATCTGLSPYSARNICQQAGIPPLRPIGESGEYELSRLYEKTRNLVFALQSGESSPAIQWKKNEPFEFTPYFPAIDNPEIKLSEYESMNLACSTYYESKLQQIRFEEKKRILTKKVKNKLERAYRKKFLQEGDLARAQERKKYKEWGELLTAYAHLYKKGDLEAKVYDFNTGEEITLPLDPRYTPIENAQHFFKLYNKGRGTERHLRKRMQQNQADIHYLESVLVAIQAARSITPILEITEELEKEGYIKTKKKKPGQQKKKSSPQRSRPHRFVSSDGLEILVGRNNRQNDWLTLRHANREDLWLHTREIPGTHVIVKLPPTISSIEEVPDKTLQEAAGLAAYFSKASEAAKVPVDYTFRSNVRKPAGARPGMVIYDNHWTINVNPQAAEIEALLSQEKPDH